MRVLVEAKDDQGERATSAGPGMPAYPDAKTDMQSTCQNLPNLSFLSKNDFPSEKQQFLDGTPKFVVGQVGAQWGDSLHLDQLGWSDSPQGWGDLRHPQRGA